MLLRKNTISYLTRNLELLQLTQQPTCNSTSNFAVSIRVSKYNINSLLLLLWDIYLPQGNNELWTLPKTELTLNISCKGTLIITSPIMRQLLFKLANYYIYFDEVILVKNYINFFKCTHFCFYMGLQRLCRFGIFRNLYAIH